MTITLSEAERTRVMRKALLAGLSEASRSILFSFASAVEMPDQADTFQKVAQEQARNAAALLVLVREAWPEYRGTRYWQPQEWLHLACGIDAPYYRQYESKAVALIEQQLRELEG